MEAVSTMQMELTGEGISFPDFLKVLQLPSTVIQATHHKLTSTLIKTCDSYGITDENVGKGIETIQQIAQTSIKMNSRNNRGLLLARALGEKGKEAK